MWYLQQRDMIPKLPSIPRRGLKTRVGNHSRHDKVRDLALMEEVV
jgi:hypothetical protein